MPIHLKSVLREFFALVRASFKTEAQTFLPFAIYPTAFRPPMKRSSR